MLLRLRNWVAGMTRGEISAAGLDGLRAAGAAAYSLLDEPPGTQLFAVCAWNAFALQTIADQLLTSDERFDPATAGRLPPSTLAFAQDCYTQAVRWVAAARS